MLQAITRRLKRGKRGISTVIVVMLSLVLMVIIVGNVVLWSYQMNQLDWEKMQEKIDVVNAQSVNENRAQNPTAYALGGSTSWVSGDVLDLATDDDVYMTFRSYYSGTGTEDFVDNNLSDVDSSADIGTHSNFSAQQFGPDSIMDTLQESNTGGGEQWVSPTGYEDPGSSWNLETRAYDDRTNTFAWSFIPADSWSEYLVLTHNAMTCAKIQYWVRNQNSAVDQMEVDIYNGAWINVYSGAGTWQQWANVSFSETSVTKMRFRFHNSHASQSRWVLLYEADFLQSLSNYELDLEVQWTNVDYDEANEQLCIYGGTMGGENIRVDVWTGSTWDNLFSDLSPGWNNVSVSSYLASSTFTIRFKGGTETSDSFQDSWNIDAALLRVEANEYTSEVEFTGLSNVEEWTQLDWTTNIGWTIGSVNVTLQLYNFTLDGYPTSGDGYVSYTSDSSPNVDQTISQTINTNPTDFRNTTGYWKIKIKGTKTGATQFDLNVDWIEIRETKRGTLITFENGGSLTSHVVSLWVNNSTSHQRYDIDFFVAPGETATYFCGNAVLSGGSYTLKVSTERGNAGVFSGFSATFKMEWGTTTVDDTYTQIDLQESYVSPVIVCTPNYTSGVPRSVRTTDVTSQSFKVRVQNPSSTSCPPTEVSYLVVEEGVWTTPIKVEAVKYSTNTVGRKNSWVYDIRDYQQSYSGNIIVLHQVMSYNDPSWITTYVSRETSTSDPPDSGDNGFRIALNGAEAATSHANETIGYIIFEAGFGEISGIKYDLKKTGDSISGYSNSPPYNTAFSQSFDSIPTVVLAGHQEADGGDGGWCVVHTITQAQAGLMIDEDQVSDSDRSHTSETCGFFAFESKGSYS